jgi:DNA (cytosine-5)-methyltransferase 1
VGVAEYYFREIGINVLVASDIDAKRCDVHQFLYPETKTVCGDIRSEKTKSEILKAVGKEKIDIVISTPPCQGMSSVGKNRSYSSLTNQEDERNYLILESFKIIDEVSPSYILFENVPRILKVVLPYEGELLSIEDILKRKFGDEYNIKINVL